MIATRTAYRTTVYQCKPSDMDCSAPGWFGVVWRVNQYGLDPQYDQQFGPTPSKELIVAELEEALYGRGVPYDAIEAELAQHRNVPGPWWKRWFR